MIGYVGIMQYLPGIFGCFLVQNLFTILMPTTQHHIAPCSRLPASESAVVSSLDGVWACTHGWQGLQVSRSICIPLDAPYIDVVLHGIYDSSNNHVKQQTQQLGVCRVVALQHACSLWDALKIVVRGGYGAAAMLRGKLRYWSARPELSST